MWDEGYVEKLNLKYKKKNYGKYNLLINQYNKNLKKEY